ncbi:P protein-like [Bolinopsis microptera]|uniref:P protein-like n=1 Tax=Bolinopsis microptera TaxID=2820187 RepID=UPI00307928BA
MASSLTVASGARFRCRRLKDLDGCVLREKFVLEGIGILLGGISEDSFVTERDSGGNTVSSGLRADNDRDNPQKQSAALLGGGVWGWELLQLLNMMLMVALLADSGFFDWTAVKMYELSKGRIWVLLTLLNVCTAVMSGFLDNVTTILLITPITITLCQVMHLDVKKVILAMVMFSNLGGASTGIGDPPNVLIINSPLLNSKITFGKFTGHMMVGSILCSVAAYIYFWLMLKRTAKSLIVQDNDVQELLREAKLWQRIADRSYIGTTDEVAVKEMLAGKAAQVTRLAEERVMTPQEVTKTYNVNLPKLRAQYGIRDKGKLVKTATVLIVCILLFFVYSLPIIHTTPGEVAMAGAIALIIVIDHHDMEGLLHKVEWTTLMFFAGLFILVECLEKLGLIGTLGEFAATTIKSISPDYQLAAAISIILWMAAIISAFIDNIPFTAAIIPVISQIVTETGLPLEPLVYALAFGACLGGNGTLIGASANIVAVGIAEEKGYKISFFDFMKLGLPVMFVTVTVAHIYLLVCHCWFGWGNG